MHVVLFPSLPHCWLIVDESPSVRTVQEEGPLPSPEPTPSPSPVLSPSPSLTPSPVPVPSPGPGPLPDNNCSASLDEIANFTASVQTSAISTVAYAGNVVGYFRHYFKQCNPQSTLCTESTFNGAPGVFEVRQQLLV